jgi:hypothetical protein
MKKTKKKQKLRKKLQSLRQKHAARKKRVAAIRNNSQQKIMYEAGNPGFFYALNSD